MLLPEPRLFGSQLGRMRSKNRDVTAAFLVDNTVRFKTYFIVECEDRLVMNIIIVPE